VNGRNAAVRTIIQQLQEAFNETLNVLYDLPDRSQEERAALTCKA
jgi:hypothetical protein